MEHREVEQADRIADVLYAISRFIVVVCILPVAIWFATFALLETIISDVMVRVLVSSAFGIGLFGILLIATGRIHVGAIMVDLSILTSAVSLAILWNAVYTTIACTHGYFVTSILVIYYLKRKDAISVTMWKRLISTSGILALITGPSAIGLTLLHYSVLLSLIYVILPLSLVLYLLVIHLGTKDPRFGIIHAILLGITAGMLSSHVLTTAVDLSDLALNISVFLLGLGIGMLVSSQVERELGRIVLERRLHKKTEPSHLDFEDYEDAAYSDEQWIINSETAQVLSGISVIFISIGSYPIFLWLAHLTELGLIPEFEVLFIPFTLLLSLLILAPSPVLFRLGHRITRNTESVIVRGIGFLIVLLVSITSYTWTQYNSWNFFHTLVLTILIFIMGITGLFKRIRRLWRILWLRMVRLFRAVKSWIITHPLQTGIAVDGIVSSFCVFLISPLLIPLPDIIITLPLVFITVFSLFGVIGLLGLKKLSRRNQFLAVSWVVFLCTVSCLVFWALSRVWLLDIVSSIILALQPLLLSIIILKIQVPRLRVSILYLPGVLSFLYLTRMFELQFTVFTFPLVTILALIVLLAPILYPEYSRLLAFLLRIILISSAGILCCILILVEIFVLIPLMHFDFITSLTLLSVIFFAAYLPFPLRYETESVSLKRASILGLAFSLAALILIYTAAYQILIRLLVSFFVVSCTLFLSRNSWPEKYRPYLLVASWCLGLGLGSFLLYTLIINRFSELISILTSGLVFSICLLPLQRVEEINKKASLAYLILAIPFGSTLAYYLTYNPIIVVLAVILLPIPVAYHQYNRMIRYIGEITRTGIRIFLIYAALNIIISLGVVGITVSYFINQFLSPFFASYPIPIIPISLTFILVALAIWSPAFYIRRAERPIAIPVIITILSVVSSLTAVTLIQHSDWMLSGCLVILISTTIITLFRNSYPEEIHRYMIPVTWCSILGTVARFYFLNFVTQLGETVTTLSCLVLLGIGFLPLKFTNTPSRIVDTLYGLFVFPAALLLTWILNQGFLFFLVVMIIVPIPIAYKQYIRGLKAFVNALVYGMQLAIMQIALHLVVVIGFAAAVLSGVLVYLLYPFFQLYPISAIPSVFTFVIILLLIWLPSFAINAEENQRSISVGLVILCSSLSINIIYLIQNTDLILSVLGLLFSFGSLMALASGRITYLASPKYPALTAAGSLVLIGIYLAPVDIVTKSLLIVLSGSLFSIPFISESYQLQIAYPLFTGSFIGVLFWQFFLPNYDAFQLIVTYVCIETLLLSYVNNFRKYTWCIFSVTLGIIVSIILQPIGITAIPIGIILGMEILWRVPYTPELESILGKVRIQYVYARSILLALIGSLFINQGLNNLVIAIESFILILLVFVMVSNRKESTALQQYAMLLAITLVLSSLVLTITTMVFLIFSLSVFYPPLIIVAIFLALSSKREPYRQLNWHMFSVILALLISMGWFLVYSSFDPIILYAPTFVSVFLLLELKIPETDWKSKSELIPVISSLIFLTELLWVWHATRIFLFGINLIFIGTGVFLLLSIFYPLTDAVDSYTFRTHWKIVSVYATLCLTNLFTGWDMLSLQLPNDAFLSLSVGLILYALLVTPYVMRAERLKQLDDSQKRAHREWIPAIIGITLWSLQYGLSVFTNLGLVLGFGLLMFSLSGIILIYLQAERNHSTVVIVNLSFASSLASIFWISNLLVIEPVTLVLLTVSIWLILSLPVTYRKIMSFLSLCQKIISENKFEAVIIFPIIIGAIVGSHLYLSNTQIPILELILIWNIALVLIPAFLYFAGSHLLLDEDIVKRLHRPAITLLGLGSLIQFLASDVLATLTLIVKISLSVSATLILLTLVSLSFGLHKLKRIFYGSLGLALSPFVYTFLSLIFSGNLLYVIPWAILLILIFEAPLFSYQLKLLVKMLKDLGLFLRTLVQKFNEFMQYIFDRYGYIAWTIFSVAFVMVFGIISYPFFSELLNMPIAGFLYIVPSFGFPTMILGLLLLFIAIVRRKVKSSFGSVSGFLTVVGFGANAFCGLYENGYPYLSVSVTILSICLIALILRRELDVGEEYFAAAWVPIPLTIAAILVYYLYIPAITLEAKILAVLLSMFPACCMYIASSYVSWIPKKLTTPLWIILSLLSGTIAYLSSYLAFFPPLAAIYLSVFIASFVMYPVTGRKMIHLFFAPLFFALTGFAFTFLFGVFYQNLLLALASALFFVSRFVKEKRDERPELGYLAWLRVAILITLLLCVGLFVATVLLSLGPGS